MSDGYGSYRTGLSALAKPRSTVTQYQRELFPHLHQVREESSESAGRLKPLQQLFDLLQRGQYVTANMMQEIITSAREGTPLSDAAANVVRGAVQGISGQTKGDWTEVNSQTVGNVVEKAPVMGPQKVGNKAIKKETLPVPESGPWYLFWR